jgi:hypothetical protein
MKKLIITIVAVSLLGCSTPDPIDGLSRYINESRGLWINGLYPKIDLPVTATTSDVLDEAIKKTGFDKGHIKKYRIITTRKLILYDGNTHEYTAVMIDSDLGDKIILMRHNGRWLVDALLQSKTMGDRTRQLWVRCPAAGQRPTPLTLA